MDFDLRNKKKTQETIDDLKAFIEASDNTNLRIEGLSKLKSLENDRSEIIFHFLENLLISESSGQIRSTSAKIIREKYLEKAYKPMRWSLEHDEDPLVFTEAYNALIDYFRNISIFDLPNICEYLKDIIFSLKRHQLNIAFQDFSSKNPEINSSVKRLSSILINYFTLIYLEKKFWRIKFDVRDCKVTKLDFLFKSLTILDASIRNLDSLESLILRYNQLTKLPEWIGEFDKLELLNLNINNIEWIPSEIGNLNSLKQLLLWKNNLKRIPEEICNLKSLEIVNLRLNSLKKLPENIGRLENLINLNLHDNKLKELPTSICYLYNLKNLNLSWNEIEFLPENIGTLRSLEILDLERNKITQVPTSIGKLNNLKHLNLSENNLKAIPPSIGGLSRLKSLNISRNKLQDLPDSLVNLKNLKDLYISDNKFNRDLPILKKLSLWKISIYSDY